MRKLFLKRVPDTVRVEPYLPELRGECGDIIRMAMSDRDDGMAAVKVQVFIAFVIADMTSFRRDGGHIKKAVYVE